MSTNESHVYTHTEKPEPTVNLSIEKNTKGFNWGVTVIGASSVAEGLELLDKARDEMASRYGGVSEVR
jgi:hypothetical protein